MSLDLRDCSFYGPALPEPFVKFQLDALLAKKKLLPKATGEEGKKLQDAWESYRRKLRDLGEHGGAIRVRNHVIEPLVGRLGYAKITPQDSVSTREGMEDGGALMETADGKAKLRAWAVEAGTDLDAPAKRGRAYRFSPSRIAQRVLLAKGERLGLLSDGGELRLLICDPARPDSHLVMRLDRAGGWRSPEWARRIPDSYRLLLALASPAGVAALSEITEAARLTQTAVTSKLRRQAREAIEGFIQRLLDHPDNKAILAEHPDKQALARDLWREGLILVYRLLFVFKLESSPDPARVFSFASSSPWRNTYSPNFALAQYVEAAKKQGAETGGILEGGLRALFKMFVDGLKSSGMNVTPLGGALFGKETTPLLDRLRWGEEAVIDLLDNLLWTPEGEKEERRRVYYGSLDVEDLGRVYEALLELEPGISTEPMCRLRRAKLEVVVPLAQGEKYRAAKAKADDGDEEEAEGDDEEESGGKKTKVIWVEEIPARRFFLRVGLGRKASGSYYTPHPFVRFLVQETLGPQVEERSPKDDPNPGEILKLRLLDPAMGSGHFLVEACRYLGEALYEACRLCDELASEAERKADGEKDAAKKAKLLARAAVLRKRVQDLPDPDDELLKYLPSRAPEGEESGLSQWKALAMSRRMIAVHCLYGVDKNRLAVELAKLSLWLESYAEGLPLTFMDHRLVCGDSLTGPFFEHLLTLPRSGKKLDDLFAQNLTGKLQATLNEALSAVHDLEASVGKDVADNVQKAKAKERLDAALAPFKTLAAAWSGGVMLGDQADDAAYQDLARAVAAKGDIQVVISKFPALARMIETGREGVPYDLAFPEVFFRGGKQDAKGGFDAVFGNPPWEAIQFKSKEFFAAYDFKILDAPTKKERQEIEARLTKDNQVGGLFQVYTEEFEQQKRVNDRVYEYQKVSVEGDLAGRQLDAFRVFMERNAQVLGVVGRTGVIVPSAFHANEGATGVRKLYLEKLALKCCYSFENRNKLFDIDSRFKFAAVVAQRDPEGTKDFGCAFYLHQLDWLFGNRDGLNYSLDFVKRTGGEYLSLLELRSTSDAEVARICYSNGVLFGEFCEQNKIRLGSEHHMTNDSHRFTSTTDILPPGSDPRDPEVARELLAKGYLPLHEGKTFHQYDDRWGDRPRYLVALDKLSDKPGWVNAASHYRVSYREIARATDERTSIFNLAPPGFVFGHKGPCEREPGTRQLSSSLVLVAFANSFIFDFNLRLKVQSSVSLFILNSCPVPSFSNNVHRFLAHSSLRLSCNHPGYTVLWKDQVGDEWREASKKHTWPVIGDVDERWKVRAAIDAVVADAYGLTRDQYQHVLSSFSHTSYPKAPELCLAAFDELKKLGLEKFTKKHDPYWDVPLNEALPKPVIDLPIPEGAAEQPAKRGQKGKRAKKESGQLRLLNFAVEEDPEALPRAAEKRGQYLAAKKAGALPEPYEQLVKLLREKGSLTVAEAQAHLGLSVKKVEDLLVQVVEAGVARVEGQPRSQKYTWAGE